MIQTSVSKILYISDSSIPSYSANSVHVMKMCQAMAKRGNQVTLLGKNTLASKVDVKDIHGFYGVESIFNLQIVPRRRFAGSGRWYNLILAKYIHRKSDLIYTRSIYAAAWCWLFRKRLVFEVHEPFDGKGRFLSLVFRILIKSLAVTKVVAISQALKFYLVQKHSLQELKVFVAHDGADPLEATGDNIRLPGNNQFKVGYVGSLLKGKGAELIIALSFHCSDVDFHIVGGSEAEVISLRQKLHAGQTNIFFHGFIAHGKTTLYIKSFDVLLAPYQEKVLVKRNRPSSDIAQWMSPLKLFEYMSSKKPMIVSDLPVIREVLQHEKNALLCDPNDLSEWTRSIRRLQKDPDLREKVSKQALDDFLMKYTWDKRAENIFQTLAGS